LLRVVLFLQVLTLSLLIGAGIYIYNYVQVINSEIETVMSVIQDIQALLPKLNATADAVSSLQSQFGEAFKTLSDLSLFFNNFLELFSQLQGNS
jgi:ABC-type transporter Mla subunit MlaD